MSAPRVFISSREQELEPEREFAGTVLEAMGMHPVLFESVLVPQSSTPRDAYLDGVESSELFVLILWQQDSDAVIEEYKAARRRGKQILCLQKEIRLAYNESPSPRLQEFIRQIARDGYSSARFRTLAQLQHVLRQGLVLTLARKDSGRFRATGKEELFTAGTELIEGASRRVVLVAKTPIPLVGTRPYDDSHSPLRFEQQQLFAFERLIDDAAQGRKTFRCVATKPNMKQEMAQEGAKLRERARHRITECFAKILSPQSRFELRWIGDHLPSSMSYLIADDDFLIWLSDGTGESIWLKARNERMAAALDRISMISSTNWSLEEINHFFEW